MLAVLREPQALPALLASPDLVDDLVKRLEVAPDNALGVPLAPLLAHRELHAWILTRTPPLRVLFALQPASEVGFAATLDDVALSRAFFDEAPRERGLAPNPLRAGRR